MNKVSIIGLGKLGSPLAACLSEKGFSTIGLDLDARKVEAINEGHSPIYEPGLEEMIQKNKSRLRATLNYEDAVINSEVTFIVVPTPSDENGGFSLRYVLEAMKEIGQVIAKKSSYHLVILTSTVMPGATAREVKPFLERESGKVCGEDFGLCYSPEFVALGSVIRDFLNPDLLLIGESDSKAGALLEDLYKKVCENRPHVARMNFINAEITKLAVNAFVTTKITYANMLARLCESLPGADVDQVTLALGHDTRIGSKYLKGALGYGGPCFPRDNVAFSFLARQHGIVATLAEATHRANRLHIPHLVKLLRSKLPLGGTIGILGLAYKPNTDVVEESQGLLFAQMLLKEKIQFVAYDPVSMANAKKVLGEDAQFAKSLEECIKVSDVLVITTPWEVFKHLPLEALSRRGRKRVLVDCWRFLEASKYHDVVEYIPLGIGLNSSILC